MEMESKKLFEAVQNGDLSALSGVLARDPLVLDKIIVLGVSETPLHVASVGGHADLVEELLTRSPGLASELDSRGNTPLHLAAAKGDVEIVRLLLSVGPAAASVRNLDGRAPIHVAAIKGREDAVARIIGAGGAKSARELTDRGETALHLAVANGKIEVVRAVVGAVGERDRDELLNRKDCDGNCILHIAVAKKQTEIDAFTELGNQVRVEILLVTCSTSASDFHHSEVKLVSADVVNYRRNELALYGYRDELEVSEVMACYIVA